MLRADIVVPQQQESPHSSDDDPTTNEEAETSVIVDVPLTEQDASTYPPADPNALVEVNVSMLSAEVYAVLSLHRPANEKAFAALDENTRFIQEGGEDVSGHGSAECTICLEAMKARHCVTKAPCDHTFHYECLSKWMATKLAREQPAFCPNCNHRIVDPMVIDGGNAATRMPRERRVTAHPRITTAAYSMASMLFLLMFVALSYLVLRAGGKK